MTRRLSRSPVVLISFNRPELARQVFEAVRRARPPALYLVSDGPRWPSEEDRVARTRAIYEEIDWDCEVHRDYAAENLGCHTRIYTGLSGAFERFEEAIVLEDDTLPAPDFFPYCEELLERYRDEPRVMQIAGTRLTDAPYPTESSYIFTQMTTSWGWASWRRVWQQLGPQDIGNPLTRLLELHPSLFTPVTKLLGAPGKLSQILLGRHGWRALDADPALARRVLACGRFFTHGMKFVAKGFTSSWDFALAWLVVRSDGLVASPAVNLVTNTGCGVDATHARDSASAFGNRPTGELSWPLTHPDEVRLDPEFQRLCARWYDEVGGYA